MIIAKNGNVIYKNRKEVSEEFNRRAKPLIDKAIADYHANIEKAKDQATKETALEKQLNCGWIPFIVEYDEDYKMDMLQGIIPDEDEEILVSDGKNVWSDTFMREGNECYLDSGCDLITQVIAWMPLPEPYEVKND